MKTTPHYYCPKCGWEGSFDELEEVLTLPGDFWHPAEYDHLCPECEACFDDLLTAEERERELEFEEQAAS